MKKHYEFITTKITTLIEEAICALSLVGHGIENCSLEEYIFNSLLLNMLGFQEQKLKCILWEYATYDYDIRYALLDKKNTTGDYTEYDKIKMLYNKLKNKNKSLKKDYSICLKMEPLYNHLKYLMEDTNLSLLKQKNFLEFSELSPKVYKKEFKDYFPENLKNIYYNLYNQRNRIAHNTLSYQENLPKFESLTNYDHMQSNCFLWFYVLCVIDEIFIQLYKDFINIIKSDFC